MEELLESSVWRRKSLMSGDKTHFDEQVQRDLHEATLKEVELGHLHGPFSESQVSEHFGTDRWLFNPLAALVAAVADSLGSGTVAFDMSNDTSCSVAVHPEVGMDSWCGRTLDLSRACKQLAMAEASRRLSVVGYFHDGEWVFFRSDVLPFGAIGAVYSFNRVSRSLHHLICKLLWGPWGWFMMTTQRSAQWRLQLCFRKL